MQEILTQKEFMEKYNAGQREFADMLMQFFDITNMKIYDLVIKNSKIMFCNFSICELKNIRIENCTAYFVNFYTGTAKGLVFNKCDIEQMLFDTFSFNHAEFSHCNIRWSGILNSNSSSVDMATSSQYKFFTDIAQVTARDVEEAIGLIMHDIERLDVSTRMKVKEMIRKDVDNYGLPGPTTEHERKQYDGKDSPLTYGEVKGLVETTFGIYGSQDAYKTKKSAYETNRTYKR